MIESSIEGFQRDVVEASLQAPVLVDFWAPWCAPCLALGPILEKLEAAYAGAFKLVKIDSDQNPEISKALGIRSIPLVVAFVGGRPVDQFSGALPEGEVRAFIDRLLPTPSQAEHARAHALLEAGDAPGAIEALNLALSLDATNDEARLDLASFLLERDEADSSQAQLGMLSAAFRADPQVAAHIAAMETRIEAIKKEVRLPSSPELEARIANDPRDLEARLELAELYIAHQAWEAALEQLIDIVQRDRAFREDIGRITMLRVFDLASTQPQLVSRYRRMLSSAVLK
jgi:putative thioredoxin